MARRRIKQAQLARMLGQNDQWVSVRINGYQEIGLNDLDRIAAALGVQPAALLSSPEATRRKTPHRSHRHIPTLDAPSPTRGKAVGRPPSYPTNGRRPALIGRHTAE